MYVCMYVYIYVCICGNYFLYDKHTCCVFIITMFRKCPFQLSTFIIRI